MELVGLTSAADRKVGSYSGGMRRRIDLIGALMPSPPLLFLDEPTTGLDPQSRMAIWEQLTRLNRDGVTILLTTQMMDEADHLCQRLAIIDQGRIIAGGSPQELKSQMGGDVISIAIDSAGPEQRGAQVAKAEGAGCGEGLRHHPGRRGHWAERAGRERQLGGPRTS